MAAANPDPRVEHTIAMFSRIYLGGIPATITHDSSFLSFISILTAIEALAGFRFANEPEAGKRFARFIDQYFPAPYKPLAEKLWRFRCRMIHGFSPAGFSLTHHQSENHFKVGANGNPVLNAEDFYAALAAGAQAYFAEVRADSQLQALLVARLEHSTGGSVSVQPIVLGGTMSTGTTT